MKRTRQARAHHHTFKDEDMSSTTTLTPREKQARRYATTLALIATLGPFFYGFEGMVLNAAIKAVGSTFELGPILQGVAGAAGVIGGLIGALAAGRISDKIGRKTTLMWVGPFLLFEAGEEQAQDDRELAETDETPADVCGGNLRDVAGGNRGCRTKADAANDAGQE